MKINTEVVVHRSNAKGVVVAREILRLEDGSEVLTGLYVKLDSDPKRILAIPGATQLFKVDELTTDFYFTSGATENA